MSQYLCDNELCKSHCLIEPFRGFKDPNQKGWSDYQYSDGFKANVRKVECKNFDPNKLINYCASCNNMISFPIQLPEIQEP